MGMANVQSQVKVLKAVLALAVLVYSAAPELLQAADENPFKSAKVGDWVEFKQATQMAAGNMEATMKQTVTAKDEKTVTLKMEVSANGMKPPPQEVKIELDKPYDPTQTPENAKIEKLKEGDETITAGGKEYKCHWVQSKVTVDHEGTKFETESKSWISKDAPLGGLVKMEMEIKAMGTKTLMELTGSGKGQ